MASLETPQRIEPARIEEAPEAVSDVVAELSAASARLENALHPKTAEHLAGLVREMNTYYSNLIEGHHTRPRDIRRALQGQFDQDEGRRNFQLEAAAHVRLQEKIEKRAAAGTLPEPASSDFILWLHREFYKDAPDAMLRIGDKGREFRMDPGRSVQNPSTTTQWAGTSHRRANASATSWNTLPSVIASSRWARRHASWRSAPHTIG